MLSQSFRNFALTAVVLTILALIVSFIFQGYLPVGDFTDWFIAIISFWWLIVIVRFPWDIHFQARAVVVQTAEATARGIDVEPEKIVYAQQWVTRSVILAIGLHLVSAVVLFVLAATGVSVIGYIGSVAALLLTGLRPLVRGYQYIVGRLSLIEHQTHYPREDVVKLREDVHHLATQLETLQQTLDLSNKSSWATHVEGNLARMGQDMSQLGVTLRDLQQANQVEHQQLSRNTEQAVAKITADGQFLDHVREIIRFVKMA